MTESQKSAKFRLPKLNHEFFKNNLVIVLIAAIVIFLILDIVVWGRGQKISEEIHLLLEKKEKIESVKEKVARFQKEKPYLKEQEFRRKVLFGEIPPIAAMRRAGIIISEIGAQNLVTISEEKDTSKQKGNQKSRRGGRGQTKDKRVFSVGSKTVREIRFTMKFTSSYPDLMKIFEKLSSSEPLITVTGFKIERPDKESSEKSESSPSTTGDPRVLKVELTLSAFAEVVEDEEAWSQE